MCQSNLVKRHDERWRSGHLDGQLIGVDADRINEIVNEGLLLGRAGLVPNLLQVEAGKQFRHLVELVRRFVASLLLSLSVVHFLPQGFHLARQALVFSREGVGVDPVGIVQVEQFALLPLQ